MLRMEANMKKMKLLLLLFFFLMIPLNVKALGPDQDNPFIEELTPVKLFDTKELENVTKIKSMTITDKYFVILTDYIEDIETQTVDPVEPTAIFIYDKETYERVAGPIVYEHEFNDLTYNPLLNKIFLVGEERKFFEMDPNTFEAQEKIQYTHELLGIAYRSNQYIVVETTGIDLLNDTFIYEKAIRYSSPETVVSANVNGMFISETIKDDEETNEFISLGDDIIEFESLIDGSMFGFIIKNVTGDFRVIEFDNETPYLLYQTTENSGEIYVLTYDPVTISVEIPIVSDTLDVKNMTFKATVKDAEGKEYEIISENGVFTIKDLAFNAPGNYQFYVTQIKDNPDILYDSEDISFTVQVRHQAKVKSGGSDIFADGTLYIKEIAFQNDKKEFRNEILNRSSLSCKEVNGKFYNKEGYEVTKEEYLTSCGLVENPDTGSTLPILIFTVGLGLAGTIFYFSKNKIFKV